MIACAICGGPGPLHAPPELNGLCETCHAAAAAKVTPLTEQYGAWNRNNPLALEPLADRQIGRLLLGVSPAGEQGLWRAQYDWQRYIELFGQPFVLGTLSSRYWHRRALYFRQKRNRALRAQKGQRLQREPERHRSASRIPVTATKRGPLIVGAGMSPATRFGYEPCPTCGGRKERSDNRRALNGPITCADPFHGERTP